jgi:hypothetical protein
MGGDGARTSGSVASVAKTAMAWRPSSWIIGVGRKSSLACLKSAGVSKNAAGTGSQQHKRFRGVSFGLLGVGFVCSFLQQQHFARGAGSGSGSFGTKQHQPPGKTISMLKK